MIVKESFNDASKHSFHLVIERLMEYFNVDEFQKVAHILGMSGQSFYARRKTESLPYEQILNAVKETDINFEWLFYGIGEKTIVPSLKLLDSKEKCDHKPNIQFFNDEQNTTVDGKLVCSSNFKGVYIDPIFLPEACKGNIAAFQIRHESMGDTLKIGDIIFIDRNRTSVTDGKIHIIDMNGSIVIKRIYKMADHILVNSDDKSYPEEKLQEKDITILGTVIYKRTAL